MTETQRHPVPPVALTILAEAGRLATDAGQPVYWVETTETEPGPGGLITGISVLEPGTVGVEVYVPGHWVHRSVNVGRERLATLFCYAADAGQDYSIIEQAGGMKSLVVVDGDGWAVLPNPNHRGYQPIAPS